MVLSVLWRHISIDSINFLRGITNTVWATERLQSVWIRIVGVLSIQKMDVMGLIEETKAIVIISAR
jgi:hypothetical protein